MQKDKDEERTKALYKKAALNTFGIIDSIDQEISIAESVRRKRHTNTEKQSK